MEDWIDGLAGALGEEPPSREEASRLLAAARDVAHRVERKATPLAAFLVGAAVGRAEAGGVERGAALEAALGSLADRLPESPAAGTQ